MIDRPESTQGKERHVQYVAQRYPAWYVELCLPITLALAAYNWADAEAGMRRAKVEQAKMEPEPKEGLELVLATQRFFLALHRDGSDDGRELWPGLRERLVKPPAHPIYEPLRIRQFIIHRCRAAQQGWEPLALAEVNDLLAELEPSERNQYLWHELAMHAYCREWDGLLQQAYSELSMCNDGLMGNWFYHHSRLMLRLRAGTAQRQDLEATLSALRFTSQTTDLRETVLPVLQERGWLSIEQLESIADRLQLTPTVSVADLLK